MILNAGGFWFRRRGDSVGEFDLRGMDRPFALDAERGRPASRSPRTVLPDATFWNDWTKHPFSMTIWAQRPLGVQVIALAYRSGDAWNETGYSNKELDEKITKALTIVDVEERRTSPAAAKRVGIQLLTTRRISTL